MGGISFHHVWHQMAESGDKRPIQVFNLETMAAYFGKFGRTEDFKRDNLPPVGYAYHLGAGRYAAFLRRLAESRGGARQEGKIADVVLELMSYSS